MGGDAPTKEALLHLAGFDHEGDAEARRMEGRERRILASLGFPDPYAPVTMPAEPRWAARKSSSWRRGLSRSTMV